MKSALPLLSVLAWGMLCYPAAAQKSVLPVRFANGSAVKTLDFHKTSWMADFRVIEGVFEGLFSNGPNAEILPGVAHYPATISDDKLTWTFHLRKDATWSNGDPVTANDFLFAWNRVLDPATASDYASLLYFIEGAEACHKARSEGRPVDFSTVAVRAPDPHTLVVRLVAPTPFFDELCAFPTFFPLNPRVMQRYALPHRPGDYDPRWATAGHLVGNGPFLLEEWQRDVRIVLRRRSDYWDAANTASDTIIVLESGDPAQNFAAYENNHVDILPNKPSKLVSRELMRQRLAGRRNDVHPVLNFGTYYFIFNCRQPPFDDARVRRAFSHSAPRALLVSRFLATGERPTNLFVPPETRGYTSPPGIAYDVELARKLLAEAGYPGGAGFPNVKFIFNTEGGIHQDIATVMQRAWLDALGVRIQLEPGMLRAQFSQARKGRQFNMARGGWYGDYDDPMTFLDMFITDGGNNDGGFSSSEYDRLIAEARLEIDPARREKLLQQAEHLLINVEAAIIPLFQYADINLFDPDRIKGFIPNRRHQNPFKYIYRVR